VPEYQLFLRSSPDGETETMQLDGENVVRALETAHGGGFRGLAELWYDGRRLCDIEYSKEYGYWTIVPPVRATAPVPELAQQPQSVPSSEAT
jgi:hypothetical protein